MTRGRTWSKAWVAAGVLALAATVVFAQGRGVREAFPEPAIGGEDPADYFAKQLALKGWLLSEMPSGAMEDPIVVGVSERDLRDLEAAARAEPNRGVVGLTKQVGRTIDLSGLDVTRLGRSGQRTATGTARSTDDGGFVWATAVVAKGAAALRIRFGGLQLPSSADLFVYTLDGQAFGPYRDRDGSGDVWSNTFMGSTVIVQLRHHGPASASEMARLRFRIEEVGHIGDKFRPAAWASPTESFCGYNVDCIENAECSGGPAWSAKGDAQNATAMMLWISGAFIYTCTGGLVADADAGSQIPYFLTANHCLSRNKDAGNLNTFFQYKVNCNGSCPAEWTGGGIQRSGSSVVATNRTGDYTLLRLSQSPPSGSAFMGWTTANVANANGTGLFRISHPATAPQAYSAQSVDTSAGTCTGIPRGDWIYSRDTYGATEGGSSGSPVYNAAGQIVGQLTGACGFNVNDPCDSVANATIDGAFANYYDEVAPFLDGGGCNPSPEVCDDGVDNDCDGATDCSDADCSGDPACDGGGSCVNPGGAPAGDSCTSDAQCCSNKCKGGPGNKTCR